jgi:hypothetical protein
MDFVPAKLSSMWFDQLDSSPNHLVKY